MTQVVFVPTLVPHHSMHRQPSRHSRPPVDNDVDDNDKLSDSDVDNRNAQGSRKSRRPGIKWTADHTDRLLDWLEQNVKKRHLLFSDSQEDATKESRKKGQAKSSKVVLHGELAQYVFGVESDPAICATLKSDPELGRTGAGLTFEQLERNPEYTGPIGAITAKFKMFHRLHGFWRKIPSYNPFTMSSDAGQDHEAQAYNLLFSNTCGRGHTSHHDASNVASAMALDIPAQQQQHYPVDTQTTSQYNLNYHPPNQQLHQLHSMPQYVNHRNSSHVDPSMTSSSVSSMPYGVLLISLPSMTTDPNFFDSNASSLFPGAYHQSLSSLFQDNHSISSFESFFSKLQHDTLGQGQGESVLPMSPLPQPQYQTSSISGALGMPLPMSPTSDNDNSGFSANQYPPSLTSSFFSDQPPASPASGRSNFFSNLPQTSTPPPATLPPVSPPIPASKKGKHPATFVNIRDALCNQLAASGKEAAQEQRVTTNRRSTD
ncbi:hypothetical protein SERLA73DRAFT_80381 [Serpula lacrymans var. lacrymans S7.3]|uniref:Uncharacterized protein n=2 Tax=Serpula lacrymans var. lacrymans TaxID=341189 RepID=F8QJK8_SERL3|nr:uncharacterized protein SERLADRAFT_442114 [Serpula lacrymans var. lacrymans S7.9]EGN91513.1 hypothetical protein SERLA73DRAFT_80381 [Serpula lacrymans var. lacrymans S7.3]EGO20772.1 hypothetical protein SERLADRAFT_442114 [Serpula lacrymans var. lacrymans S7.9]